MKPKLRFPEFQGEPEWIIEKLGAVASLITERAGNKKCIPMSITSGVGLVSQQEKFGRTIAGNQYENYLVLRKNDFAYNKSSTREFPQGFIAKYSGDEPAAVPNSIFTCFRVNKNGIDPDFLKYLFLGNLHGKWLRKYIEVSARAHGSLSIEDEDFLSLPIPLPSGESSHAEQQKVAECLTSLDELIAAHGQKHGALKSYKKGLMRQLFPDRGETVPRLRFPEFRHKGAWEEGTAGSMFMNRLDRGEEGLPIYSVTIHDGMVRRDSLDRNYYDIEEASGNKKACKNDIAYNMMRMWQGALGVAPEDCLVSPAYIVLVPQKHTVSRFFEYLFKLPSSLQLLTSYSRGLTNDRLRLYYDDFASIPLCYPSDPEEQQRIADCLTTLDEQITAQSRELEVLKQYKQGLLQQLFASPEVEA